MPDLNIPYNWKPRDYQIPAFNAIASEQYKRGCLIWHRRAGKDLSSINLLTTKMVERVGLYWHVLPSYTQAKKIVWNGITAGGRSFLDHIPPSLIDKTRDDELIVHLKNGSKYQLIGGDNPDRLVGANPVGIVFSEYSLQNPECWDLMRPILNENDGWALFIYTPRGYNHGYELFENAQKSKKWFVETLDVTMTKRPDGRAVVTEEMIEEDRLSGMPEELIRQEYYCDWSAPMVGSVYGDLMDQADRDGRICDIPFMPDYPVSTSWDLGMDDATAIWFYQIYDGWVNFIDFYDMSGEGIDHYATELSNRRYTYKEHFAPHDIKVRELGAGGQSRFEVAWRLGLRFTICKKHIVNDGIDATKRLIKRSRFNRQVCEKGIKALRNYRKEWDRKNKLWTAKPLHDWSSHACDAIRIAAMTASPSVIDVQTLRKPGAPRTMGEIVDELKGHREPQKRSYI